MNDRFLKSHVRITSDVIKITITHAEHTKYGSQKITGKPLQYKHELHFINLHVIYLDSSLIQILYKIRIIFKYSNLDYCISVATREIYIQSDQHIWLPDEVIQIDIVKVYH